MKVALFFSWILSACVHGVQTTVCIVDAVSHGFQCANKDDSSFIKFEDGKKLLCTSPEDTEAFMKACKNHKLLEVTVCRFDISTFLCMSPQGNETHLLPAQADNYFCLSIKDRKRLIERCRIL